MRFDFISDLHLDFQRRPPTVPYALENLIPSDHSKVLVIAGDLGHCNDQNIGFLHMMRKHYDHVILVYGNHDLYVLGNDLKKFGKNSQARIRDMIDRARAIDGVHYLDGDIVEVDGMKIGGCGMWYDGKYATNVHNVPEQLLRIMWLQTMKDSVYIYGMPEMQEMFESECIKLERIIDSADIIVSHIGPDWSHIPPRFQGPGTGFFYFDGAEFLKRCDGKVWIYGHTHDPHSFMSSGCQMICNPLGYPYEKTGTMIRTFEC